MPVLALVSITWSFVSTSFTAAARVSTVSRIMKVARTIADLAGEENIGKAHVLEALAYRNLDGSYWK